MTKNSGRGLFICYITPLGLQNVTNHCMGEGGKRHEKVLPNLWTAPCLLKIIIFLWSILSILSIHHIRKLFINYIVLLYILHDPVYIVMDTCKDTLSIPISTNCRAKTCYTYNVPPL